MVCVGRTMDDPSNDEEERNRKEGTEAIVFVGSILAFQAFRRNYYSCLTFQSLFHHNNLNPYFDINHNQISHNSHNNHNNHNNINMAAQSNDNPVAHNIQMNGDGGRTSSPTSSASSSSHHHLNDHGDTSPAMEEEYQRLVQRLLPKLEEGCDHPFCQYWIGVAGGPGSGKSTVANDVAERLNQAKKSASQRSLQDEVAVVIGMDGWHFTQEELLDKFGDRGIQRKGAPFTFNVDKMIQEVHQAKHQGQASLPEYSREKSDPVPDAVKLTRHHKIVFVEGLYVLMKNDEKWGKLNDLWDETWFIQAPSREEQVERLVKRSLKNWTQRKVDMWGPGRDGALKRAKTNDLPNMDVVAPSAAFADEIIINK